MFEQKERTELGDLGEFGLIKRIAEKVKIYHPETKLGIGDDAAVLDCSEGLTVVSTDTLVEGVHFDLMYVPLKHLGYKAMVVNLSDIYAMNGTPKQVTVSMAISSKYPAEAIDELYDGIFHAAKIYNVDVVGGDTTSSQLGLILTITVIGQVPEDKVTYRSGASDGDLLVVSGDLGGAYMGLQVLEREKAVFKDNPSVQPDLDGKDYILERQLKPEARKDVPEMLQKLEIQPTAMIDISDGLASEIIHLCEQSSVGCHLYEDKIPIDPTVMQTAEEFNLDPTVCALSGGEDYELLFTISQNDFEKVKGSPHFSVIGHMTDKSVGRQLITRGGQAVELIAQGWTAFSDRVDPSSN